MISINGVVLTNQEVIKKLEEETGSGRMKADIDFTLLENYESIIPTLNDLGERKYVKKFQATYGIVNQYERRNFKDGGTDTVIYYTQVIPPTNTTPARYLTNDLNKIIFHHGRLTVRPGQEDLLLFLRLSERCKTNKYWEMTDNHGHQKYTPMAAFNYKEVIPEKVNEENYDIYHLSLKAQATAVSSREITFEKAIQIATSYGMRDASYVGEKAVRLFLAEKAKANPEKFLEDIKSASFEIRAEVNTALMNNIIKWDAPYIKWVKGEGDTRICQVPNGKEHVEYFTFWLRETDRSGVLERLRGELEKHVIKGHGIEVKDHNDKAYQHLLTALGVSSIEEAQSLIHKQREADSGGDLNEKLREVIDNIKSYTPDLLRSLGQDNLRAIARYYKMRGAHNMQVDTIIDRIMAQNSIGATA